MVATEFALAPTPRAHEGFEMVAPLLAAACARSRGRLTPEAVLARLEAGHMQLWLATDERAVLATAITELVTYAGGAKYCRVVIGTGRRRTAWQHGMRTIEDWARAQGCAGIESIARKGWARTFTDWDQTHVFIEKQF